MHQESGLGEQLTEAASFTHIVDHDLSSQSTIAIRSPYPESLRHHSRRLRRDHVLRAL